MKTMERNLPMLACLFFLLLFAGFAQAQTNLIVNGTFENWTDGVPEGWRFGQAVTRESDQVREGGNSVRQTVQVSRMWQRVEGIAEGNTYTISYWFLHEDSGVKGRIWSHWLQGEQVLEEGFEVLRPETFSEAAEGGWRQFTATLVAPPGADGFHFEVQTHDNGGGGSMYYDDFGVYGETQLAGGGHETFDSLPLTGTSYDSGNFGGQDGSIWTFVECRADQMEGNAIMIGRSRPEQSYFDSGIIGGGLGELSFEYKQAYTANVHLLVLVNDQLVAEVTTSDQQGEVLSFGPVAVEVAGDFQMKFIGNSNNSGQVSVDNIVWTGYDDSGIPATVETLAELRSSPPDGEKLYVFSGEALVSHARPEEGLWHLQDATGAMLLHDPNGVILSEYLTGDLLTGIQGHLLSEEGRMRWVPVEDPGEPLARGVSISPFTMSLHDLQGDYLQYEAALVELPGVSFVDPGGVFVFGEKYFLEDGAVVAEVRTLFGDADYLGAPIPGGNLRFTALVSADQNGYFLTPRRASDMRAMDSQETFAVVFTVIDDTETLDQVMLAGDMTGWDFATMLEHPAHNWSVTLNIPPGQYAWNAATDQGGSTTWLMPESHLNVAVAEDGSTSGDLSYVYMVASSGDLNVSVVKMYPNPAGTVLHIVSDQPVYQVEAFDIQGRKVYGETLSGVLTHDLEVGKFQAGIYLVRVITNDATSAEKIQFEP